MISEFPGNIQSDNISNTESKYSHLRQNQIAKKHARTLDKEFKNSEKINKIRI